ncbi:hypothetical protein [Modestobacter excelsi]|nr:hypothetical protein [Modestobacter excelsi]
MQESSREHPVDDETARTEHVDGRSPQAPVVRVLANPRRIRRA